jgi:hypothetical protein
VSAACVFVALDVDADDLDRRDRVLRPLVDEDEHLRAPAIRRELDALELDPRVEVAQVAVDVAHAQEVRLEDLLVVLATEPRKYPAALGAELGERLQAAGPEPEARVGQAVVAAHVDLRDADLGALTYLEDHLVATCALAADDGLDLGEVETLAPVRALESFDDVGGLVDVQLDAVVEQRPLAQPGLAVRGIPDEAWVEIDSGLDDGQDDSHSAFHGLQVDGVRHQQDAVVLPDLVDPGRLERRARQRLADGVPEHPGDAGRLVDREPQHLDLTHDRHVLTFGRRNRFLTRRSRRLLGSGWNDVQAARREGEGNDGPWMDPQCGGESAAVHRIGSAIEGARFENLSKLPWNCKLIVPVAPLRCFTTRTSAFPRCSSVGK